MTSLPPDKEALKYLPISQLSKEIKPQTLKSKRELIPETEAYDRTSQKEYTFSSLSIALSVVSFVSIFIFTPMSIGILVGGVSSVLGLALGIEAYKKSKQLPDMDNNVKVIWIASSAIVWILVVTMIWGILSSIENFLRGF